MLSFSKTCIDWHNLLFSQVLNVVNQTVTVVSSLRKSCQ